MNVVRFVGDPCGYLVPTDTVQATDTGWMRAKVGATDRTVLINIRNAYLIEVLPDTVAAP